MLSLTVTSVGDGMEVDQDVSKKSTNVVRPTAIFHHSDCGSTTLRSPPILGVKSCIQIN